MLISRRCGPSTRSMMNFSSGDSLASQLFAGHITHEKLELDVRHVAAYTLETTRQILSHAVLSAFQSFQAAVARAEQSGGAHSSHAF